MCRGFSYYVRYVFFLVGILFLSSVSAQSVLDKGADYYRSQYVKLYKAYLNDTGDVEVLVKLSRFYTDEHNPMFNIPLAKKYINRAEGKFHAMLKSGEKDNVLRRLINHGITVRSLSEESTKVTQMAVQRLETEELNVVEVDQYLECFQGDKQVLKLAGVQRVNAAYRSALRENTIDAYASFIKKYSGTDQALKAEKHIGVLVDSLFETSLNVEHTRSFLLKYDSCPEVRKVVLRHLSEAAYRSAAAQNSVEAYRAFLEKYPSTPYSMDAYRKLDSLLAVRFSKLKTANDYVDFALANDGTDLADRSIDEIYRKVMDEGDVQAALLFMKHFSLDPRYADVYRRYYEWHAQDGCHQLIEFFLKNNPDYPFKATVASDLNEAADIEVNNLAERFDESRLWNYTEMVKTFPSKRISHVAIQRSIQNFISVGDWVSAAKRCESLKGYCLGYNKEATESLYELITTPYDKNKVPETLNIDIAKVTNVVMAPSGNSIYYTRLSVGGTHEVCLSELENGRWVHRGLVEIEGCDHDDVVCFSLYDNGQKMLIGVDGDILVASGSGLKWHVVEIPPYPVNTDFVETDAFMLADGSGIVLASDRPSGYNVQTSGMYFHGDEAMASDIYYIPFTSLGWGDPVNLGFRINTCYCERYPVVSQDLKTILFVSDCGGGLGYGDIYVSRRADVTDWQSWSQPHNLGIETNTAFAESGLSLLPDGHGILYVSTNGGSDTRVLKADVPVVMSGGFSSIRIEVKDAMTDFVDCAIYDAQTGERIRVDFDGSERSALLCNGQSYIVSAIQKDHWLPMFDIIGGQKQMTVEGKSLTELNGQQYHLPHLKFKDAESDISILGRAQLEQLFFFLHKNPTVNVDVIVDYPGVSTEQCHQNSLTIGEKVKAFLVSSGVASDRVSVVGRGNLSHRSLDSMPSVSVKFNVRQP